MSCLGRQLVLRVRIRRFRCINAVCRKRTFAEHPSTIAQSRARHTDRLRTLHHAVALALGGNAGARMAGTMAIPVGATTLLRRIRQAPLEALPPTRVLGVDDWAWRKGQRYGTILCDLERDRVIDLTLPRQTGPDVTFANHLEEGHDKEDAEAVHGRVQGSGSCSAG